MHSLLMEATKHLIHWCTHHWWRQQITSFIDALFIDGGNITPHLLMHSSLMEATKYLIYWCTLCWWRQQITSFIDAFFVNGGSFIDSFIIDGGKISPHLLIHSSLMEVVNHLIYWCTHHWWRQQNTSFIDALIIDEGSKSPHSLMHSLLMEATNHLIYWCTEALHWWRQHIASLSSRQRSWEGI